MNVLDLFSGIGGFSLGLERAGMRTVAFCEIEPFCRRVLAKHWPSVPCYDDIRTLTAERLRADGIAADVICGGFPCQDISVAGKGAGIEGERSGLWGEYARIIGEIQPRFVIVENVAALLGRGLGRVLGDLAALRFDAEWHCIPASAVGAPHRRDRIWIVAYATKERCGEARPDSQRYQKRPASSRDVLADANGEGLSQRAPLGRWLAKEISGFQRLAIERCGCAVPDTNGETPQRITEPWCQRHPWPFEPNLGRVAHGVSGRVDRIGSLGNAVVPQIPEIIGRAIMNSSVPRPS